MPRAVDLSPQNFKVDHNPLDELFNMQIVERAVAGLATVLSQIPKMISDLVAGLVGFAEAEIADVEAFFGRLRAFFGTVDFTSPSFNPITAAERFVTDVLVPTGLIPTPEGIAQALTGAVGDLEDVAAWSRRLTTSLFGDAQIAATLALSAIPGLPLSKTEGLETALGSLLPTATWNSYLTQANSALQTGGADLAHLITGLTAVPLDNVTGLTGRLAHLTEQGLYDAAAGFGNQATSVLRHLDQTGRYDAAQLTGALNTALTVAGTEIGEVASNAASGIAGVEAVIAGAGVDVEEGVEVAGGELGALIDGASTAAHGVVDTIVQTGQNDATLVNQSLATAGDQLAALFSSAPQQLQGLTGVFGVQDFITALGAHKANTTATQTLASSVAAALDATASPTGTDITVDFTSAPDQASMDGVMLPGNGGMHIADGQAVVDTFSTSDFEVFPTEAGSDYIVIEVTLGALNNLTKFGNQTLIIGRSNSARDTYTAIGISVPPSGGPVTIGAYARASGVTHSLGSTKVLSHAAEDDVLAIVMGNSTAADVYVLEVLQNDAVILGPIVDTSQYSQLGTGQRYVGFLLDCNTTQPPGIKKVRYYDNTPSRGERPFAQLPPNNALTPGGLYFPSDTGLVLRDNGTSWDRVMGGVATPFTAPPTFDVQTPLGTVTLTDSADARLLTFPNNDSGALRGEYSALPSGTYFCQAYVEHSMHGSANQSGLVISDGTRFILYGPLYSSNGIVANQTSISTRRMTSTTAFNSYVGGHSISGYFWGLPNWLGILDDGVNRYYAASYNGTDWFTVYSESRTTFLTASYIGWGGVSSGDPGFSRLRSFDFGQ